MCNVFSKKRQIGDTFRKDIKNSPVIRAFWSDELHHIRCFKLSAFCSARWAMLLA